MDRLRALLDLLEPVWGFFLELLGCLDVAGTRTGSFGGLRSSFALILGGIRLWQICHKHILGFALMQS
jgi:hypothetical protein